MKRNLYTNSIEKIKAPNGLVEKSINTLYGAENHNEVFIMNKNKHFKLKLTAAIAASLVLVFVLSMVMFKDNGESPTPDSKPVSHPFILSVNAADSPEDTSTMDEINKDAYVKINKIKNFGQGFGTTTKYNENGDYLYDEIFEVLKEFTLELDCSGENIETVTYTAHNTYLSYKPTYAGLKEAVDLTEAEREKYKAYTSFDGFGWASSCTFDYNCQPKSTLTIELPEDSLDGTIPLRIAFNFELEEGKYTTTSRDDADVKTIFEEEFNARSDQYALDVTANFADGTSTTKTLKFKCESDSEHLYLSAIEDIS
ncbi:MAG: hypothetical protein IJW04_07035 [Ruminococcus sp.]|nr:hypothetical protein [Ruminococcus sp.]